MTQTQVQQPPPDQVDEEQIVDEESEDVDGDAEDPVEPPEDDTEEPPGAGVAGMPWWGIAGLTLIIVALYLWTMSQAWDWIVTKTEDEERGDWAQLRSILDKIDYLVLFVLGAVFGISAQSRQTSAARDVAKKNKKSAQKQRQAAVTNGRRATRNKTKVNEKRRQLSATAEQIDAIKKRVTGVQRDPRLSFVSGDSLRRVHLTQSAGTYQLLQDHSPTHALVDQSDLSSRSPELDDLIHELDELASQTWRSAGS